MKLGETARFELLAKLGEGGMGIVYKAHDRVRDMQVALKTLRNFDPTNLYRFKREFRALSDLSHPNIITYYELISRGEDWFITMELVEGPDFLTHVSQQPERGEYPPGKPVRFWQSDSPKVSQMTTHTGQQEPSRPGLSLADFLGVPVPPVHRPRFGEFVDTDRLRAALAQLAAALHALHRARMVHRDLKPSNVRITRAGRVVLMDFGIVAELSQPRDPSVDKYIVGTPAYMAPEQVSSRSPSAATDWYAFGVLLYIALTGQLPFQGQRELVLRAKRERDPLPPSALADGVPEDLEGLCLRLLSRAPRQRPNADEILLSLGVEPAQLIPALTAAGETMTFVGRGQELHALFQAFVRARNGGSSCVLVVGPSGIGKTSLLERFIASVYVAPGGFDEPLILSGRCHEREIVPYKAFDGIIDDLSRHVMGLRSRERRAVLPADVLPLTRLFPMMRRIPGCDVTPPPRKTGAGGTPSSQSAPSSNRDPKELRLQATADLRALLAELAFERPVIVRIEDIQWADSESRDLLLALLAPPAPEGLLVMATLRSEALAAAADGDDGKSDELIQLVAELEKSSAYRRIDLGPLSDSEQRELIEKLAVPVSWQESLGKRLWRDLDGHPMLLAELARYANSQPDALTPMDKMGLEDVIWRRVSRLPDPERALLEAVAVAGEPTPLDVLASAAEISSNASERASTALQIGNLVRRSRADRTPWLTCYHDKVREAVGERLDPDRTRALHHRLALALETRKDAAPSSVAQHFRAADLRERAASYFVEAAAQATDQLAFDRAAELNRAALDLIEAALSRQEPVSHSDQETTHRELEILRCRAWLGLADRLRIIDRTEKAIEILAQAEPVAARYGLVEELAHIHCLHGNLLFPQGDLEGCLAHQAKARDYARQAGSPEWEARALSGLGDAQYVRGRMASAYQHFSRCIEICEEHGLLAIASANWAMRGVMRYYQNDLSGALGDCERAAAMAVKTGDRRAELVARSGGLGMFLYEQARHDEARAEIEGALALARSLGAHRFEPYVSTFLGKILAHRSHRDEAEKLIEEAFSTCLRTGIKFAGPMTLGALAQVTAVKARAEKALRQGQALLVAGAVSHNYLFFYRDAMDAMLRFGEPSRAEEFATALEEYARDEPLPWSQLFVARGRALAACARGEPDLRALRSLSEEARRVGLLQANEAIERAIAELPT